MVLDLTQDEVDEIANWADDGLEDWLNLRGAHKRDGAAWRACNSMVCLYRGLLEKLGVVYDDTE